MSDYRAPLADMLFTLRHTAALDHLTSLPAYEHVDADVVESALDEAARFMAEVVAPTNRIGDEQGAVRHDDGSVTLPDALRKAYQEYCAAGWSAVTGPIEFGGHGFPAAVGLAVQEMLTSSNMALSLCPMLTASAIVALREHGTPDQQATYLPRLISGEWTGTMVLTEPEAGSDVGALRTKAIPADDGTWSISGTKIFITWGEHDVADNIIHLVLARVPDAPPGTRGISLFIVPKFLPDAGGEPGRRNAVHCVSIEHKLGIHASPTCVLAFDGATGFLVGEINGGMRLMFTMMNDARLNVGLEGLAVAERAYQQALAHATDRRQGRAVGAPRTDSSPIIEHPDVRRMLMTMKAYTEAMRALMYDNAAAIDRSHAEPDGPDRERFAARAALLTPLSKAWGTDLGVEMTSLGIQIHGGMGYVEETGAAQFWRDARIAPIYEGTNGIQAIDLVMRKLPMDDGAVVLGYLGDIDETANAARNHSDLAISGTQLAAAVATARRATETMLQREDVNDRLAGASPYLRLLGTVAGAGYLVSQALVAAGDDFGRNKVATAVFYCSQLLPQVHGLLPAVEAGASELYAAQLGP